MVPGERWWWLAQGTAAEVDRLEKIKRQNHQNVRG